MPQIYDVDVREPPAEPTGVQEFFSKLGKVYKERQDQDFIGKIIQDVEKNDYSAKSIQKGIFDVAKGNLSPSKRLEAMNALKGQQEAVLEESKLTNARAKSAIDKKAEDDQKAAIAREYGIDPARFENMTAAQAGALVRNENKGGVTSKPVTKEVADKMQRIVDENPGISNPQLQLKMDQGGVPQANSKPFIEALQKEGETSYKRQENISKRFDKPIENIREQAIKSDKLIPLTEASIENNEKYSGAEGLWDTALEATQSPFLGQFKSKTGQQLEAYIPLAVSSFGQKMSGTLTNQKLALITKKAVGLGKDKNANRLLLYMDLYDRKMDLLRAEATNEIIDASPTGLAPRDFDTQLNNKLKPYQKMVSEDITALLDDQIPTSEMSRLNITPKSQESKKQARPGYIRVKIKGTSKEGDIKPEQFNKEKYELVTE